MRVTKDKYELPLVVEESVRELAKKCDTNPGYIYSCISHAEKKGFRSIYKRVIIEDGDNE